MLFDVRCSITKPTTANIYALPYTTLFRSMLSLTSGIAALPAITSAAEGPIGVAAVVRNTVSQLDRQSTRLDSSHEWVRNEVVRTATDSDARLVFRDDTNLSLGPGSTLKLDRTVFDDPKPGDIAIKLTQGAFRFVTGNSNKEEIGRASCRERV